ncbi:MAG: hypothetical protein R2932_48645 [Caldilineaceae bacterium]
MKIDLNTPETGHCSLSQPMEQRELQRRLISALCEVTKELEEWEIGAPYDLQKRTQAIIKRARAVLAAVRGVDQQPDPMPGITRFDGYEIAPVREEEGSCEICAPSAAHFWTLYGHIPCEGVEAIADLKSKKDCEIMHYRITGHTDYFYNGLPEEEDEQQRR